MDGFVFESPHLSDLDKEGIRWRTILLELNWYFGFGLESAARIREWRRAAALFVLQKRHEEGRAQATSEEATALWEKLEDWYTFRFRVALRRLNRSEKVIQSLVKDGHVARAKEFVRRWHHTCEPALSAQDILNERPHLFLLDNEASSGVGAALAAHKDSSLRVLVEDEKFGPRKLLTFLSFSGPNRQLVVDNTAGQSVVHRRRTLSALRSTFGDNRVRTTKALVRLEQLTEHEPHPDASAQDQVDQWDEQDRILRTIDAIERQEGTARAHYLDRLRHEISECDPMSLPSTSRLAQEAGVDESTMRRVQDSVNQEIAKRLDLAG